MGNGFHLAIIPDGNRRWANLHGKPIIEGHRAGIDKLKDLVGWCKELGITTLTIWVFSTENANRSKDEVEALFKQFEIVLDRIENSDEFEQMRAQIKIRFIGQLSIFPKKTIERVKAVEAKTAQNSEFTLAILCGYGGRQELVDAANRIISDAKMGIIDSIDEETFRSYLYAPELSDPDLIFRSSGEKRLSGFLPWQTVYSEFYFSDKLWPDITKEDVSTAISEFKSRKRRFGKG